MSLLPNLDEMTDNEKMAVLESIQKSIAQSKEIQKQKIAANVDLVVQALKKIETDIRSRFDDVGNAIEKRVSTIKDGRDGINGKDGRDGKDGKNGRDGAKGDRGERGQDGRDGSNGVDGVSVSNARIDFDGSLIITLSTGVELNVGEVVAPDLAESIKVITNGGGTSQYVLDTLASLQTQITNLIPSQTGNSGKFLTTNGSALSWASVAGGLSYQGTWNASTNTPTLTSSVGVNGYYYIVSTAGSTNLNGITDWQIGDWLLFNGSVWQKIDQSNLVTSVNGQTGAVSVGTVTSVAATAGTGITVTGSPITSSGTLTITNSAPDQTVALTQGGTTTITGTYPNFTISSADQFSGTVTSVAASVPAFLSVTGSPVTTTGTLAIGLSGTALPVLNGGTGVTTKTGTGNVVLSTSPSLTTPVLGTPTSVTLTNATGLPVSTGVSGLGTSVATALAVNVGTAGAVVVNGGALGTPSSGTVTNLTGTASININGTVGATTASSGAFTTLSATGVTTVQAGTAALPAITRSGNTNTGIFFPAADTIAFSEGGVESMRIDSSGNVGIGTSTLTSGVRLFASNGTSGVPATTGTTQASGALRIRSGSNAICDFGVGAGSGTTTWIQAADQTGLNTNYDIAIQPNGGNVGIATASPAYPLTLGNNKRFGSINTAGAGVNFAILDGSNNLTFGDDSTNTGSLTIQSRAETKFVLNGAERMRISAAGYVTYTANPAFNASLNGSNQSVTNGSTVTLTYGTVNHNRGSAYNNTTFTFTAPVTGMYQFNARVRVDGITGGANYGILGIVTTGQTYYNICSASGSYNNLQLSVSAYMTSGHTAYVILSSAGQTLNAVNNQPIYSDFSGFLIG